MPQLLIQIGRSILDQAGSAGPWIILLLLDRLYMMQQVKSERGGRDKDRREYVQQAATTAAAQNALASALATLGVNIAEIKGLVQGRRWPP